MYDKSQERSVFVASLPFMNAAKGHAIANGMNDHGPLHAQRVHSIVGRLGALIALSTYERDLVCAAALLHDIGMAKDRENHHTWSESLVLEMVKEGKLPFTDEEAEVVATLCKWHRREYDANAVHQGLNVRTGVLASLLRLADAMDLDYRRSEDYLKQESVISRVHDGQAQHHLSVRNILGVRIQASQMGNEVQLLVDQISHAGLQLERLVEELIGTPIAWPVKLIPVRGDSYCSPFVSVNHRALIFSYCNAYGIVQAGMSKNALGMAGFSSTVVCDMERTGNSFQFWENTLPQSEFENVGLVAILGLYLPDDLTPFLNLVRQHSGCRWVYATPLDLSHDKIAALLEAGIEILLGDARLLFVGDTLTDQSSHWIKIAGLCNADDWLNSGSSFSREEFLAARGLRAALLKHVESKADQNAFDSLVDKVASGTIDSLVEQERDWSSILENRLATVDRRGRVLIIQGDDMPGRFKYDLAHLAIERQGVLAWAKNEFATPYAICRLPLPNGRERVLYLSRFSHLEDAVPVKYFVPYAKNQLGSGATIWQTYESEQEADRAINRTVQAINEFFSCED